MWAEAPQLSAEEGQAGGSWGWPGKAAGESMESMRERETWNLQERAEAVLPCPRIARQVSLEALTWKIGSICVRRIGLDQKNNLLI